jgi:hypothetical protein
VSVVQEVRTRAADCLGKVTQFSPRVDPIVNDLCKSIESATSPSIQESTVSALAVRCLPLPSQLRAVFVRARCVCGVCVCV